MSNVVQFPKMVNGRKVLSTKKVPPRQVTLGGKRYNYPTSRSDYLKICKEAFSFTIYVEILCSIMDDEFYGHLNEKLKKVVDSYYEFKR